MAGACVAHQKVVGLGYCQPHSVAQKGSAAKHPSLTMHCRSPSWLAQEEKEVAAAVVGPAGGRHPTLQRH